jgi:hypothetical protein
MDASGQMINRDEEHLRLLQIGYYILAAMCAAMTVFGMLYAGFMGVILSSMPQNSQNNVDPRALGGIFAIIGGILVVCGIGSALLTFLTARFLAARSHRVFCIVIAALTCLQIPWGSVIGVCTIMVLSRPTVTAMFGGRSSQPPPTWQ